MSSSKQLGPAASDGEAPRQSPEGTAALTQPLSQRPGSPDSNGGLRPTPERKKDSEGHQSAISRCSDNVAESSESKVEKPLQNFVRDSSSTSDNSSIRPGDGEETSMPPRKRSRLSRGPSDSDRSSGQEVDLLSVRLPGQNVDDGMVKQEFQFISWTKMYNQYLERDSQALLAVGHVMHLYGLTKNHPRCMPGLIRCVAAVRSCQCRDPTAILACLERHSLFPKAQICIAKNLPDLESRKEKAAYVRAVMAAIVLFAGGVCDIQELVGCLQRPTSPMSLMDINEMLYCTATLLYAMRGNGVQISNRFYYNVFYYLRTLENAPCRNINPELQDCSPDLQPTREQQQILNHALTPGERVKIVAFAGTGKTYTLIQYTKKWSELKFLYLAFNSSIQEQAEQLFPENVTCHNFHSLAKEAIEKFYERELELFPLTSYVDSFLQSNRQEKLPFIRVSMIVQTLTAFFASADDSITVDHMPKWCKNNCEKFKNYGFGVEELCQIIVEEAKKIWREMQTLSPTGEMVHRMTQEGYLKLWQLQKPLLSDYDVILVDEAQDCTPAMADIVRSQKCSVILVGDPHQKIYSFRGADITVFNIPHNHIFYLTQSFRFGSEIAYLGATILDVSKGVRKKMLVGNEQESDVSGVGVEGTVAHLSRTTKTVFKDAVKLTCGDAPAKIHLLGGLEAFDKIRDIWALRHSKRRLEIQDPFIKSWEKGFRSFKNHAEETEDEELKTIIAIVKETRDSIPDLLDKISQHHVSAPEDADHILGTVYKAKGLEFDTVQIAKDFENIIFGWNSKKVPGIEATTVDIEWNLLYVAVTRAKKRLILPCFFANVLKKAKEYCARFELADKVPETISRSCLEDGCFSIIPKDSFLILKKMPFVNSYGKKISETLLCPSCAARVLGPIAQLAGSPMMVQEAARAPEVIEVPPVLRHLLEDL